MATETRNSTFRVLRQEMFSGRVSGDDDAGEAIPAWEEVQTIEAPGPTAAFKKLAEQGDLAAGTYALVIDSSWHQKELRAHSGLQIV